MQLVDQCVAHPREVTAIGGKLQPAWIETKSNLADLKLTPPNVERRPTENFLQTWAPFFSLHDYNRLPAINDQIVEENCVGSA
jgi:hypothetical protein